MQYNHFITGRIIRELREQRGVTQEVLSGLAAVSRSHLAEIETGHTNANRNAFEQSLKIHAISDGDFPMKWRGFILIYVFGVIDGSK